MRASDIGVGEADGDLYRPAADFTAENAQKLSNLGI